MSPMTAIRAEVAMGGRERLEEAELEGEGPERQHKVGACTNVLNIGNFFGFLLLARTRANNSVSTICDQFGVYICSEANLVNVIFNLQSNHFFLCIF